MRYILPLFLILSGCGLLHEKEGQPPTLRAENPSEKCELPATRTLIDRKVVTKSLLQQSINCVEKKVNNAFDKLRGEKPNELSVDELRSIQERGVADLGMDSPIKWEIAKELLPLVHPEGRPALTKSTLDFLVKWARDNTDIYLRLLESEDKSNDQFDWAFQKDVYRRIEDLIKIISPRFRMSLTQAKNLAGNLYDYAVSLNVNLTDLPPRSEVLTKLEGFWVLKSFVLEDTYSMGVWADLSGKSLRKFFDLLFKMIYSADLSIQWALDDTRPGKIPANLPLEWDTLGHHVEEYISQNQFAGIDSYLLSWAIEKVSPSSNLPGFVPDLIKVADRLTDKWEKKDGLHPISLRKFLRQAKNIAQDYIAVGPSFGSECSSGWNCSIIARDALKDPILKHVALKSNFHAYTFSTDPASTPKRLDYKIAWYQVANNLIYRSLITTIFQAFDSTGAGKIPLDSKYEDELKDTFELAYTFLRFASLGTKKFNPETQKEEPVPNYIMVKPDKLSKVIGLVGDRWMLDGDNDGFLNAEEFYSVTQVYEDIQARANWAFSGNSSKSYLRYLPPPTSYYPPDSIPRLRPRKEFIQSSVGSYNFNVHIYTLLKELEPKRRDSFFHALIGVPSHKEIEVYEHTGTKEYTKVKIQNFVESDATVPPTAMLIILERLMHKCDVNENNELDWVELDCATPLILEAAYETVSSGLINLDPGVNDGSKLLLSFLRMKGIPLSLAKLILINGGIKEFTLDKQYPQIVEWANTQLTVTWDMLAVFLAAQTSPLTPELLKFWKHEAIKRYGSCDISKDEKLQGKAELDCFVDVVMDQMTKSLSDLFKNGIPKNALEKLFSDQKAEVVKLALKLATQAEPQLNEMFSKIPMSSSPKKIVLTLEEVIRRSIPLSEMSD